MQALDRQTSAELEKLSGIVKRVTFHSAETGYTVLKVNSFQRPHEETAVIVHQSKVFAGATVDFYGEWTTHPSYGLQFKASRVIERKPATANAIGNQKVHELTPFFRRIAFKKERIAAITATARKLAVIVWNLVIKAEPYKKSEIKETSEKSRRAGLRQVEKRLRALQLSQGELEKIFSRAAIIAN
ncbi:hypothetical protein ACFS7Z_21010 [Pontibacter toksunensis]|uniref:ATP-dependent RecD2 DNA helicase OB-fold domain-containing protein n=1 Tax=Pontibacter toksunensis TaxID=1332631 RepID=A0ABW6C0Z1_9BACT